MNKYLKFILIAIAIFFFISLLNLVIAQLTEFKPDEKIQVNTEEEFDILEDSTFSILTWNIGFAGLGKEMSFFYDGGEYSMPYEEWHNDYLSGITTFLKSKEEEIDFFLLQEVDNGSRRSYYSKQADLLSEIEDHSEYTVNYDVQFVPSPVTSPMGRTYSGLLNMSDYNSKNATRYQYPSSYSWPNNLFFLKRCFLIERYQLKNGKMLSIINTHNSAYDDGSLKKKEMGYLKSFAEQEYKNGNYVVIGGDFNQQTPDSASDGKVDEDFIQGWSWAYDSSVATCRSLDHPFGPDCRQKTIDFFLISPNLKAISVKGIDLNFQHSDHHPVQMEFRIVG